MGCGCPRYLSDARRGRLLIGNVRITRITTMRAHRRVLLQWLSGTRTLVVFHPSNHNLCRPRGLPSHRPPLCPQMSRRIFDRSHNRPTTDCTHHEIKTYWTYRPTTCSEHRRRFCSLVVRLSARKKVKTKVRTRASYQQQITILLLLLLPSDWYHRDWPSSR